MQNPTSVARIAAIAALGLATLVGTPPPALADSPHPWSGYSSGGGFSVPAGARCEFPLTSTTLEDKEQIRTLEAYSDGTPRTMEVVGQLKARYTNEWSGESVVRNLTGTAIFDLRPDGSVARLELLGGHMGVGLRTGDPGGPAYLYLTGGDHAVDFAEDGTRHMTYGAGPVEDICQTLS